VLLKAHESGPYVLVGQSFGGSLVRGYATRYPGDVAGLVLIDAVHEDGYVTYGGQAHHLRDEHKDRVEPAPRIAINKDALRQARTAAPQDPSELPPPLNRLPAVAQEMWMWAAAQPVYRIAQPLEMEWSPDEAEREFQRRRRACATLGSLPLIVLARTECGYREGMNISASRLEELRRSQQADLAALSSKGILRFAPNSGHNMHVEDPTFTTQAVRDVVEQARHR
jgi:pimeloyl-ACP methyl ester carboxylesterase